MTARNDIESFTIYYCFVVIIYDLLFITCYLLSFLRRQCLLCFTGSPTVPFAAFLHLIRGYLQSIKQKQMQREEAALRQPSECFIKDAGILSTAWVS